MEDNIIIYRTEIKWENMDWIHLAQDRVQGRDFVKTATNIRIL
jgi:hypothetical protein